jgi:hypothetical protein
MLALPMAAPTVAPHKKSAPKGTIPPGPWYQVAWLLLTDAERHRLTHRARLGKVLPPTLPDSPVQALSAPTKMPGYSWAIPAGRTCPGAVYGDDAVGHGAICSSCYAGGADHGNIEDPNNRYRGYIARSEVHRALLVREQFARVTTATARGRSFFVTHMTQWIAANTDPADPYFRLHDSGDLFSPAYVDAWTAIIAALPWVSFWAPTRSWHIADDIRARGGSGNRWDTAFASLNALPNATIRPSALHVNTDAPSLPGWAAGSGVKVVGWNCPAPLQGNACQACRACWAPAQAIYYHLH